MRRQRALSISLLLGLGLLGMPTASAQGTTTYDFEACEQGWTVESNSGTSAPFSAWHHGPDGSTSSMAFHAGPPYVGDADESVISPIHVWKGGKVTVGFNLRYQFEPAETSLGADNVSIEWSNNGEIWRIVETFAPPAGSVPVSEGFPTYAPHEVSFNAPKGKLQIRFHLVSDALVEGIGASVDNVTLPVKPPKDAAC
ncbi:MAG: hypothetical protein ABR505_09745 [Actinomycetota bacterium]